MRQIGTSGSPAPSCSPCCWAAGARRASETNWELSAARAATVARQIVNTLRADPARVQIVGFGKFRPIADNAEPEGRARNRRVEVVIFQEPPARVPLRKGVP